jgi:ribosome-associated protein
LADKLVSWVKHNTNYPYHTEGKQQRSGWVLVDLGVVIVQLFITEKRKLYNLEALYC